MTGDAWPREDYPVLPIFLRRLWELEQLPVTVCRQVGLPVGTTLATMDASVWSRAPTDSIKGPLARYLSKLVQDRLYQSTGETAQVPLFSHMPLDALKLERLPLSLRAVNALLHVGKLRDISTWLQYATVNNLLCVKGVGTKSFLEIVTLVEGQAGLKEGSDLEIATPVDAQAGLIEGWQLVTPVQLALEKLRAQFPLGAISALDPRLKAFRLSRDANLDDALTTLVLGARKKTHRQEQVQKTLGRLEDLLALLEAEPFDDALARLLAACISRKHFQALMRRVGWDGHGGCSLQEAGDAVGVTRERIRQIERKIKTRCASVSYFPQLDRAIEVLEAAASDPSVRPETALRQAQLVSGEFLPYGVKVAAEFCGREVHFEARMGSRQLGSEGGRLEKALKRTLSDLGDLAYVATVEEVHARLLEKERVGLSLVPVQKKAISRQGSTALKEEQD